MTGRALIGFILLLLIVVAAAGIRFCVGHVPLESGGWSIVMSWPGDELRPLRLGALFSALAAGWSLGLAGLLLQVLLRQCGVLCSQRLQCTAHVSSSS